MARGGVNKVLVKNARNAILARGENPSIDAVRIQLGSTGSKTTIHRYLKELDDSETRLTITEAPIDDELGEGRTARVADTRKALRFFSERRIRTHFVDLMEKAASLGELGYRVVSLCIQDSPRRAHSIAAQGGINAAKNYQNDGDSVYRLFYDTVKGGDYRSRESNVYRLAQMSVNIIDQCVAQGVPFAREYGGLLDNRSFGGAQVSRTFYARGQTGQQLAGTEFGK